MTGPATGRDPQIRRSEIAIALLFLVTAAGAIFGAGVIEPVLEDPADLARIAAGRPSLAAGAALWTVNNVGFVFIAIFAWPVLKPYAPIMALAYLVTRIIESGVMMIGVMALLAIPGLATLPGAGPQIALLREVGNLTLDAGMLPLLGFSGLFFTGALTRHRLLPLWLAGFGLVGYVLVLIAGFASWFGWIGIDFTDRGFLLVVPVALWEIVLMPIWLLWKGFSHPV